MDPSELHQVQQLEVLCQQLYTGSDPALRLAAEKQLIQFQNGDQSPAAAAGGGGGGGGAQQSSSASPATAAAGGGVSSSATVLSAVQLNGALSDTVTMSRCQLLLERAESPYAQLLAANTLSRLVSRSCSSVTPDQRVDIRNYVLNYLANRPKMAAFVVQALILLYCRLTKLGWFDFGSVKDELVFKNVIKDVTVFLQGSVEYCAIGVQILAQLTTEMNTVNESDLTCWMNRHRKIAASYRDTCLYDIFQLACSLLRTALDSWRRRNCNVGDESQHALLTHLLRLTQNCLAFDFMGNYTDESADDLNTVHIPTSWRPTFLDPATVQLFFDLYSTLPPTVSALSLACLVQIASVRRSIFNNHERAKFLNNIVQGVRAILQNPQGLSDASNYHELCRLLVRLKSNYQLGELVLVDDYPTVIQLVAKFTVQSLQMWQFAPNSVYYLLSLWQRMVASVPYVKATEPHLLEAYTPEVTKAYITSRLEAAAIVIRDGLEDPLDDMSQVQQQLDQMNTICRCDYSATCRLLVTLFDETAQCFQQALQHANTHDVLVKQSQLTWLVYLIGSAIGGRVSFKTCDNHDTMDGQLISLVLQLMNLTDSRLHQAEGCEKLELAFLGLFEQFRKIYIGDQVQKTAKIYMRLSEVVGISDDMAVLSVFMRKIITNLKYWSGSGMIINRSLQLLNDLSIGYSSIRKLIRLDEVQFLLNNHTSEQFPFLGAGGVATVPGGAAASSSTLSPVSGHHRPQQLSISDLRCRTTLYTALGRLLIVELGEDEERFERFMAPLTSAFNVIGTALTTDSSVYQNDDLKRAVIGVSRDLRGLALAFNTKHAYALLFDWLYPRYSQLLVRAVQLWFPAPQLTTPVLKLFAELVLNRSQRLQFDVLSPAGILLFRETSKLLCTYGERVLTISDLPKEHVYPMRLKGVCVCFTMLRSALCGNYVNFGALRLYGDSALDDVLRTFVQLMLSIPRSDLLHYPKLSQSYYTLLECLCQDHMAFLTSLEPQVFLYIFSAISDGLQALDVIVHTNCSAALDYIITFTFKQLSQKGKKMGGGGVAAAAAAAGAAGAAAGGDAVLQILDRQRDVLRQLLLTMLNIVMYKECRNQWSVSRPLLGLILLNEEYFGQLRDQIVQSSRPERQPLVRDAFIKLMDGIEANLLTKNRDKFTQNLTAFRRDVNDTAKMSSSQAGSGACDDLAMTSSMGESGW